MRRLVQKTSFVAVRNSTRYVPAWQKLGTDLAAKTETLAKGRSITEGRADQALAADPMTRPFAMRAALCDK